MQKIVFLFSTLLCMSLLSTPAMANKKVIRAIKNAAKETQKDAPLLGKKQGLLLRDKQSLASATKNSLAKGLAEAIYRESSLRTPPLLHQGAHSMASLAVWLKTDAPILGWNNGGPKINSTPEVEALSKKLTKELSDFLVEHARLPMDEIPAKEAAKRLPSSVAQEQDLAKELLHFVSSENSYNPALHTLRKQIMIWAPQEGPINIRSLSSLHPAYGRIERTTQDWYYIHKEFIETYHRLPDRYHGDVIEKKLARGYFHSKESHPNDQWVKKMTNMRPPVYKIRLRQKGLADLQQFVKENNRLPQREGKGISAEEISLANNISNLKFRNTEDPFVKEMTAIWKQYSKKSPPKTPEQRLKELKIVVAKYGRLPKQKGGKEASLHQCIQRLKKNNPEDPFVKEMTAIWKQYSKKILPKTPEQRLKDLEIFVSKHHRLPKKKVAEEGPLYRSTYYVKTFRPELPASIEIQKIWDRYKK